MNHKNKKRRFRDKGIFEKVLVITVIFLLVFISFIFVVGCIYFGIVGFFTLFGVQYKSPYALIGFVLLLFLIGGIMDFISITIIAWTSRINVNQFELFIIRMVIDCSFTWIAIHIVDEYMGSVSIPWNTEIIAVLLLFFIEIAFEKKN